MAKYFPVAFSTPKSIFKASHTLQLPFHGPHRKHILFRILFHLRAKSETHFVELLPKEGVVLNSMWPKHNSFRSNRLNDVLN